MHVVGRATNNGGRSKATKLHTKILYDTLHPLAFLLSLTGCIRKKIGIRNPKHKTRNYLLYLVTKPDCYDLSN